MPASAQALCQLRFEGRIAVEAPVDLGQGPRRARLSGHLVEVEIGALAGSDERDLVLNIQLAVGTSGADLARLIASRLERRGIDVLLGAAEGGAASLWIDDTRYVRLRLGGGIEVDVACAEGPPKLMRILPPSAIRADAHLTVAASTALVRRDRAPIRGRASVDFELDADLSSPAVAVKLFEATSKTWVSNRPGGDAWQPHRMVNGAAITGVSFHLDSAGGGDWRIEVEF